MLSSRDCDVVFYKQEDLLRIHRRLAESIEGRLTQWSSHQTVAECFGILVFQSYSTTTGWSLNSVVCDWQVDALPLYKSYFENYRTAVELLIKRKTDLPQFAHFVDVSACRLCLTFYILKVYSMDGRQQVSLQDGWCFYGSGIVLLKESYYAHIHYYTRCTDEMTSNPNQLLIVVLLPVAVT